MEVPARVRRVIAVCVSVALATLPVLSSAKGVFGTLRANGPAWVASERGEWWPVEATRPFVLGDRLRTGTDGYLLAELGDGGAIGLFGDAEVRTGASDPIIDVVGGKVAFHLPASSPVRLTALDAGIASDAMPTAGYVEYGANGVPVVVTEQGRVSVDLGGTRRTIRAGERLVLKAGEYPEEAIEPVDEEPTDEAESKKAAEAPVQSDQPRRKFLGLSGWAWTGIAVVAAAVGGGVAAASGGGGGGDDSNGSPDGE